MEEVRSAGASKPECRSRTGQHSYHAAAGMDYSFRGK